MAVKPDSSEPSGGPTFPPVVRIAISLAAYQAIASQFLAARRIKVKRALFNEIATSGDGARDGRRLLRIDQTNVPSAGSNGVGKRPCGSASLSWSLR